MRPIKGLKEFILLTDTWFIQYEWIEIKGKFSYGLRLRYKNTGTDFKYIHEKSKKYDTEQEMKLAIKSEISKWILKKQKEHSISEIPIGQMQEFIHPQLKLFK